MRILLIVLVAFQWLFLPAQDTIRIMHYNLLNYGNNYGDCNSSNNNVDDKNQYLRTIVDYVQPDILTVNEMDDNEFYHDYLLEQVFNTAGVDHFERASLPNLANAPIMNQIYYNTQVFTSTSILTVETNYRDIDLINFTYTGAGTQQPVQLRCAVAHLKAGSDPEDAQERASETYKLMIYLDDNNLDGNILLSGDMNLYSGSESAFQNLLLYPDEDYRFKDPINQVGEWHANAFFSAVHTQSTHVTGGCPAGGGMDDRFDFILASAEIMQGTEGVKYIPGSYSAIGQDGERFDQSLMNPSNSSVPQEVLTALYHMSDHLPVVMDLLITDPAGITEAETTFNISFPNPTGDLVPVTIQSDMPTELRIRLVDPRSITRVTAQARIHGTRIITLVTAGLPPGVYFLILESTDSLPLVRKLVIR